MPSRPSAVPAVLQIATDSSLINPTFDVFAAAIFSRGKRPAACFTAVVTSRATLNTLLNIKLTLSFVNVPQRVHKLFSKLSKTDILALFRAIAAVFAAVL
jgi:hypothetical protein